VGGTRLDNDEKKERLKIQRGDATITAADNVGNQTVKAFSNVVQSVGT